MAILVSPGVSVTVTDESFYATAGAGTVPLVVIATAANKYQSGGTTAIAQGTVSGNANNLWLLTSQRDVLQTFGTPTFYSVGGSQQYDNELNEVGLFSLYEYLGIANTAYALRADIDLAQLQPSATAPVGQTNNGQYWLDLSNTTWGMFRSNGNVNAAYAWQAETPNIITSGTNLEAVVQGRTLVKITSGSDPVITVSGDLVINGIAVALTINDSISDVASKINNQIFVRNLGISASVFVRIEKFDLTASNYGDVFNLRLTMADYKKTIDLTGSAPQILTDLGMAVMPDNVVAPKVTYGEDGDYAVDTVSIDDGFTNPSNKIWEKIVLTTETTTTAYWFKVGGDETTYPGWGWRESVPRVLTGSIANPTFVTGENCTIMIGNDGPYTITVPGSGTATLAAMVSEINSVLNSNNLDAVASVYTVGNSHYMRITNYDGTDIAIDDLSTQAGTETPWRDAGILPTQVYYGSITGTVTNPTYTAATLLVESATTNSAGLNYAVGDVLTVSGGVFATAAQLSVTSVQTVGAVRNVGGSLFNIGDTVTFTGAGYTTPVILTVTGAVGGQITTVSVTQSGQYTGTIPSNPVTPSFTSGGGINATFDLTWGVGTVSVSVPGSYTTFPTSPASITGGSGSSATFDLVENYETSDTFTIDAGAGPITVHVPAAPDNTLDGVIDQINMMAFPDGPIVASKVTISGDDYLKITNTNNTSFIVEDVSGTPLNSSGIKVGYTFGREMFYQGYSPSLTVPNGLDQLAPTNVWLNTTAPDRGANMLVKQYINGVWRTLNISPNTGTVPMYSDDVVANAGFGGYKQIGSIYARYNTNGVDPAQGEIRLYRWDGTTWAELNYVASMTEPTGEPEDGTLWYSTALRYDFMVSDGQIWKGYREYYPATDPEGPILDAAAPLTQSDGSPLVDADIWVNTSSAKELMIYRWDGTNALWRQIDNTDHSTPAGIIFADARPNATGEEDGSELPEDMVLSDYVDPDAPDAHLYPDGLLLCNTRYTTTNVKKWTVDLFPTLAWPNRWVSASGNDTQGVIYVGSNAQRIMIVRALQAQLVANQDVRAETTFFNLMATPGYPECIDEMVTLNTDKKEVAFIIGDTPSNLTPDGTSIVRWASNADNVASNGEDGLTTANPYVGVYYPWGLGTNLDGSEVFAPPSMMALRTYAYNDQVAYPWFAPAGFNRGLVTGVSSVGYLKSDGTYQPVTLNQGQRDVMYTYKINPIAFIPTRGLVIYGQKTLQSYASALDRVNVARLINYLKYQLDILAKPFLFELNDGLTRAAVSTAFNGFLGNLVTLRALYDYAVICDDSNNTPARIDRNELWIDIAIKPEKAIEFIYIPIRILNTGDPLPNGTAG